MFRNDKRSREHESGPLIPPAPPVAGGNRRGMFSVLGADVVIKGDVTAAADLHVDGRIEGDVTCSTLAQGSESQIFGSVTADTARLAGAIEGAVRVRQLTIERSGRIVGDVEYETITIENGGNIDGRLKHMAQIDTAGPRAVPSIAPAASSEAA